MHRNASYEKRKERKSTVDVRRWYMLVDIAHIESPNWLISFMFMESQYFMCSADGASELRKKDELADDMQRG
jgi:hypothetical protein